MGARTLRPTSWLAIRQVAAGGRYIEGELAQALVLSPTPALEPLEQLSVRDLKIMRLRAYERIARVPAAERSTFT